ncbi:MAG TPA: succinylglutamate-semialdehyde dehydrogenase [Hyphomonadaceae bacterium]|nr:succinylglutamate-semialdehyde dehydrogenase [Hyphomonadaceae bacterium]HPN07008.1 succinylglutamate-semialdehyde dehydrogenase [Hyphomonadaceae bacterium]
MSGAGYTGECFIGGQWVKGAGAVFKSIAPADQAEVWSGNEASAGDVEVAVKAAREAFPAWRRRPLDERIALVRAFGKLVDANKAEMAAIISRATGKPLWDAATEVAAMVGKADLSVKGYHERTPTKEAPAGAFVARISHHPHGVMAVLGPFNFPGHLPNGHIMPALIAGNTVIFKPSEQTPEVAEFTVRLWEQAGLPAGVINLVQGARAPAEQLVAHDGVDGVLFTGGVPAGRAIHRALGGKPEKIVALELGGNNPLVVWDAGDLEAAARLIVKSAFITSGQRCTCSRRLIIKSGAEGERVLDALLRLTDRVITGQPDAQIQPFMGPVISIHAADAVLGSQADWLRSGGVALREAKRLDIGPAYVSPGVIDVTAINTRKDEEVFGPLLQVIRVPDFEGALEETNNTRFGLAAGLISDDPALFAIFEAEVRAGVLNWNRQTTGASGSAPFGGVGQSGNHRPAGYYAADYSAWPMASLVAAGAVKDDEAITGLRP